MDSKYGAWKPMFVCVAVVFLASLTLVSEGPLFISPDETANAFFARQFAATGTLTQFEPLNAVFNDSIHPRSMRSIDGNLLPSGFLGLSVIYGFLGKLFGAWTIPIWTPILAAFAVFAWGDIIRRVFDREIAWLSAVLLALHPAWWYYGARTLMPNVPFVSFLLFSAWILMARPVKTWAKGSRRLAAWCSLLDPALSGICFGLALFIRPSEAGWIVFSLLVLAAWLRPRLSWRTVAVFCVSTVFALAPMFAFNALLYGSPFATGYTAVVDASPDAEVLVQEVIVAAPEPGSEAPQWWLAVQHVFKPVFPFGIHPRNALRHGWQYGLGMFWWASILALIGLPLAWGDRSVPREARLRRRALLVGSAAVAGWLFVMYGSWAFHDNPDPSAISIANSYVRYWIPIFLLTTPAAAFAVRWISRRAITPWAQKTVVAVILLLYAALSVRAVFFAPHDGLLAASATLAEGRVIRDDALQYIEEDAVIIVDRADKLFFPERRVLYPLRSPNTYALIPRLALRVPLYYYGVSFPSQDIEYLNSVVFFQSALRIELIQSYGIESLYRIVPASP